jgi:D-sedoheptulose 7-phosphate isomerase
MMPNETIKKIFSDSIDAQESFVGDGANIDRVEDAVRALCECLKGGGKVITFGNGGSAADSQHLAAELVVRFEKERKALACIALNTDTSILTAAANDYDFSKIFSRQLEAIGTEKDLAFVISTSGMSPNVLQGARTARRMRMPVVALTGKDGGELAGLSDISIIVSSGNTARIQEVHAVVIHAICKLVEDALSK